MAFLPLAVLLVDAAPARVRSLRRLLERMAGVAVIGRAGSLSYALRQIRLLQPDLVISDLHVAGGNGLELARRTHAVRPAAKVIVVSTVGGEIRETSLASGADGFLTHSQLESELAGEIARLFPPLPVPPDVARVDSPLGALLAPRSILPLLP